jgi:hypothetical protein
MEDAELDALVAQARANNATFQITGLLLFNGLNFLQTLEGPRGAVEQVFSAISEDPRHHGVVRVQAEDTDERAFAAWSMAYTPVLRTGNQGQTLGSNGFAWSGDGHLPSHLESLYMAFNSLGRAVTAPA